jgi:hypothetical protein
LSVFVERMVSSPGSKSCVLHEFAPLWVSYTSPVAQHSRAQLRCASHLHRKGGNIPEMKSCEAQVSSTVR